MNDEYWNLLKDTAETETEVAEKSSWDQAIRWEKLGLVWRNRKKISQIINDYLCLPFFLLIILWCWPCVLSAISRGFEAKITDINFAFLLIWIWSNKSLSFKTYSLIYLLSDECCFLVFRVNVLCILWHCKTFNEQ